jgi:site-specific recombinase XerD
MPTTTIQTTNPNQPIQLIRLLPAWQSALLLRVHAQELQADTATTYQRGVHKFFQWLRDRPPTPNVIRAWKADLLQAHMKPSSVNVWLAGVRSFFDWLVEAGELPYNPCQSIKGASRKGKSRKHVRDALTDREVLRLLAQPNRSTYEGARDYAILCLMLYTATRGIELHRANVEDLQTQNGLLVLLVQGKGNNEKDDLVVLTHEAENAVRDWLAMRGTESGPLFKSNSNASRGQRLSRRAMRAIIKRYLEQAGIHGNKTTHSLRHTAITNAIRNHAPLHRVKGMSRHASLDTLMIYFHEVDRLSDPAERYINYEAG